MSKYRQLRYGEIYLSPSLVDLVTHGYQPGSQIYINVDDCSQHLRVKETALKMQNCLRHLEEWLTINLMSAEDSKSFLTVVTLFNKEYKRTPTPMLMEESISVNTDRNIATWRY